MPLSRPAPYTVVPMSRLQWLKSRDSTGADVEALASPSRWRAVVSGSSVSALLLLEAAVRGRWALRVIEDGGGSHMSVGARCSGAGSLPQPELTTAAALYIGVRRWSTPRVWTTGCLTKGFSTTAELCT